MHGEIDHCHSDSSLDRDRNVLFQWSSSGEEGVFQEGWARVGDETGVMIRGDR